MLNAKDDSVVKNWTDNLKLAILVIAAQNCSIFERSLQMQERRAKISFERGSRQETHPVGKGKRLPLLRKKSVS